MIRDYSRIDTAPGAEGENAMFSPPANFAGERREYLAWLKAEREQQLRFMGRLYTGPNRCLKLAVVGPYREAFEAAFERVCQQRERDLAAFRRGLTNGA